jgi:hypothetical protein
VTASNGTNFLNFGLLNGGIAGGGNLQNGASRSMRVGGKIKF